jgi:hypothetical protein
MCFIFHKWSKWEQTEAEYEVTPIGIIYPSNIRGKTFAQDVTVHERVCEKCGKRQRYITDADGEKI